MSEGVIVIGVLDAEMLIANEVNSDGKKEQLSRWCGYSKATRENEMWHNSPFSGRLLSRSNSRSTRSLA